MGRIGFGKVQVGLVFVSCLIFEGCRQEGSQTASVGSRGNFFEAGVTIDCTPEKEINCQKDTDKRKDLDSKTYEKKVYTVFKWPAAIERRNIDSVYEQMRQYSSAVGLSLDKYGEESQKVRHWLTVIRLEQKKEILKAAAAQDPETFCNAVVTQLVERHLAPGDQKFLQYGNCYEGGLWSATLCPGHPVLS